MITASAPARANLLGNPSDQYGGCTLACSVGLRARVRVARAGASGPPAGVEAGGRVLVWEPGADLTLRGDDFDIARAVVAVLGLEPAALHLRFETEIPRQSGMAGSTALVTAALAALLALEGEKLPLSPLAERARAIEREGMGIQCGFVDQYMTAYGGLRHVDLAGKDGRGPAPEPLATVEDLAPRVARLPFVLAFTGLRHSSDAVHRPIRERWWAGEPEVVAGYERVAAIGREGRRALLDGDLATFGALMDENHEIQRGFGGSGPVNDRLIEAARKAGAAGAKLAGAGQGGTIVALWLDEDTAPLEAALREAGATAFFRPEPVAGVTVEGDAT